MSKLGRVWRWLEPGLLRREPMIAAAAMLVIGTLVVMVFAAAGPPHGPTELPIPQPAPVGP